MFKHSTRARGVRAIAAIGLLSLGVAAAASAAAPQRTLVDLVREGKRENVLAAITSPDVDVNAKSSDGSTSLMWAAYNDDLELVRALLKAGAKANVTSNFGATALTEAIKLGDVPLFRTLLDGGADIESPNLDNQTALMLAINTNQVEMAKVLIERGANVKAIEKFRDQTALMWAAAANLPDIVDMLLAKGAGTQVNLRAAFDDWERMQTSEPRAQYGSRQTGGLTALLFATRSGCLRCAVSLIEAGADVNKPNPEGITPLINALDNARFDIAMLLLDKGANPNVWDMHGRTPIYVAVDRKAGGGGGGGGFGGGGPGGGRGGAPTGAAPGAIGGPGGPGGPPGGRGGPGGPGGPGGAGAADGGARAPAVTGLQVINRLLDMGVDTNHELTRKRPYGGGRGRFQDYDLRGGVGPLFLATMNNDHESMEALLKHGAEVDLRNVMKMTPLMMAAGMRGTGGNAGGGGGGGGGGDRVNKTIEILVAAGADINAKVTDSHNHTAVIMAYVAGRDQEGKTGVMTAAENGQDRIVKLMLDLGADPTLRDATGKSPLDFANLPVAELSDNATAQAKQTRERLIAGRKASAALIEAALAKSGAGKSTVSSR